MKGEDSNMSEMLRIRRAATQNFGNFYLIEQEEVEETEAYFSPYLDRSMI